MSVKPSKYILLGFSLLLTTLVSAYSSPQPIITQNEHPNVVMTYWTPERLKNAVPMDLPYINTHSSKELSFNEFNAVHNTKKLDIHPGRMPKIEVIPTLQPLFEPKPKKLANIRNSGTLNAHFTSQQPPLDADITYPYRAIGKLFFRTPLGDRSCTAFVINKRIIATAAHCLHPGISGVNWYENSLFIPAYRDGAAPFGKWLVNYRMISDTWINSGGNVPSASDIATCSVRDFNGSDQSIGDVVGTLGYKLNSTLPNHAHLVGYSSNLDAGQRIHQVAAQSARAVNPGNVEYGSDMRAEVAGSPIIQNLGPASVGTVGGKDSTRNTVIAIVSYGYDNTTSLGNGGVLLSSLFQTLVNDVCIKEVGGCY